MIKERPSASIAKSRTPSGLIASVRTCSSPKDLACIGLRAENSSGAKVAFKARGYSSMSNNSKAIGCHYLFQAFHRQGGTGGCREIDLQMKAQYKTSRC